MNTLQAPAQPAQRTPATTKVCVCSCGRASPVTAPWPPTEDLSAVTVSKGVSCLTGHISGKFCFEVHRWNNAVEIQPKYSNNWKHVKKNTVVFLIPEGLNPLGCVLSCIEATFHLQPNTILMTFCLGGFTIYGLMVSFRPRYQFTV